MVAAHFWECGDSLWSQQDFQLVDHSFSLENGNNGISDCSSSNNEIFCWSQLWRFQPFNLRILFLSLIALCGLDLKLYEALTEANPDFGVMKQIKSIPSVFWFFLIIEATIPGLNEAFPYSEESWRLFDLHLVFMLDPIGSPEATDSCALLPKPCEE